MNKLCRDLINSGIAGALVFAGAFVNGGIDANGIIAAAAAAVIAFLINFKTEFNESEKKSVLAFI